jgi:plasmid stabilization system protein ParE
LYNFYISPTAQQETKDLTNWYEDIETSLGNKFRDEYESTLRKIIKSPTHFSYISKTLRRSKFPTIKAMVIYKFENNFIEILSIKDTRSKPNKNFY